MDGSYKVNGVALTLQPSPGSKWVTPKLLDVDGNNRDIYTTVAEYELVFGLVSQTEYNELLGYYRQTVTGTVIIDLPEFSGLVDDFQSYSGCVFGMPTRGEQFNDYIQNVRMQVKNVSVN